MFKLLVEMSMLALEAQQAIWLRSLKIAGGGRAGEREATLMVKEKVSAAQRAVVQAAAGAGPLSALRAAIGARFARMSGGCRDRCRT